jgi:anthranilate phosphoribosyltransferase
MSEIAELTRRLESRHDLSSDDITLAARALASPDIGDDRKIAFLSALSAKGETAAEVAGFAREFRNVAIDPGVGEWSPRAIDIVGTGGDHAGAFNVSSLVVLTLACAGVPVMKHGNRGITSKCGSADLLSALGVELDASHEKLRGALRELGYAFFFAPAYHPSFKYIAPARKALAAQGRRTIFNILGPLVNPGRPAHVILGVFSSEWVPKLAEALHGLGASGAITVHGIIDENRGVDELTTATPNRVRGAGRLRDVDGVWRPEDHGFVSASFDDLKGGDLAQNLAITDAVINGRGPRGLVDTIVFNAAAALWVCGRTNSIAEGVPEVRNLLVGGAVKAKIAATREFFRS